MALYLEKIYKDQHGDQPSELSQPVGPSPAVTPSTSANPPEEEARELHQASPALAPTKPTPVQCVAPSLSPPIKKAKVPFGDSTNLPT